MKNFLKHIDEPFNGFSHLIGAIISIVLLFVLMEASKSDPLNYKLAFVIYGLTLIGMFASSSVYHLLKVSDSTKTKLKRIDHIMIFLLIAGSYTPIATVGLDVTTSYVILIIVWVIAAVGIIKKLYWLHAPRWFSTGVYLVMGWISVFIFPQLWEVMPRSFLLWIAIGGLSYTLGAIIYAAKYPNPLPGKFGHHEIWHLFVMGGAFSHFWAIYKFLPNMM